MEANKKKVIVDGVVYESGAAAARANGVSPQTVIDRINSNKDRFSGWSYGKED